MNRLCHRANGSGKKAIALFFVVLFIFGLALSYQFGDYWDETLEANILKHNAVEYIFRLFPEGSKIRSLCEGQAGIAQSIDRDHGIAVMYPLAPIVATEDVSQFNAISAAGISLIWHTYIYILSFTAVLALYYIGKKLFHSELAGCVSSLLFFFSPRFFAEMHYNNKDVLLLVLAIDTLALVISTVDAWKRKGKFLLKKIILLSFVGGLTMNTKIVGIAIVDLFGALMICLMICEKVPAKRIASVSAGTLLAALAFYFLLTPAMWGGIGEIIDFHKYAIENANRFSRWSGNILFEGTMYEYSVDPLPRYYLIKLLLLTSPVFISAFFCVGAAVLTAGMFREKTAFFKAPENLIAIFSALEFIVPMLYAFVTKTQVYNGWRHFYFVYLGYIVISAYGIVRTHRAIQKIPLKKTFDAAVGLCMAAVVVGICVNHPFEYTYYNPLVSNAQERYEMDYWNVGTKEVLKNILADRNDTSMPITVGASDNNTMTGIEREMHRMTNPDVITLCAEPDGAEYIVENITYGKILGIKEFDKAKYDIMEQFSSYGNLVFTVYKLK